MKDQPVYSPVLLREPLPAEQGSVPPQPGVFKALGQGGTLFWKNWFLLLLVHASISLPIRMITNHSKAEKAAAAEAVALEQDRKALAQAKAQGGDVMMKYEEFLARERKAVREASARAGNPEGTDLGYLVVDLIALGAMIHIFSMSWFGGRATFSGAMGVGFKRWGVMTLVFLCMLLAVGVGGILFVLPGIYAVAVLSLSFFFVAEHKFKTLEALEASHTLAKPHFWRILGFGVLCMFISEQFRGLVAKMPGVAEAMLAGWQMRAILEWLASIPNLCFLAGFFALYQGILARTMWEQEGRTVRHTALARRGLVPSDLQG